MLGHRGGAEEESGKAARQDIMSFYQDLQQHTKKKTLVHAPPNLRIGASEARDDLSNFYEEQAELEGITPRLGSRKGRRTLCMNSPRMGALARSTCCTTSRQRGRAAT